MKRFLPAFFILSCFGQAASAQTTRSKPRTLPAAVGGLDGGDPDRLVKNQAFKRRFRKLLGKRYGDFMESFETSGPFVRKGNYLVTSGCLIHACTHLESALAVDTVNKTIHAAIFRQNEKTLYFNEDGRKTPPAIRKWAANLAALNK